MPKMKLTTTAERFIENRLAISYWLLANKINIEFHLRPNTQKVTLLFDNTNQAWDFQEHFEEL